MGKLRTKKAKVEHILRKYPATRIDDRLLVLMYWKHFDNIATIDDCATATPSETITRLKRKINEEGRYNVTDEQRKEILKAEFEKAAAFKEKLNDNRFDDGMISIKVPSVRKSVFIDHLKSDMRIIEDLKMVGGIYTIYDKFSNPLYVGISNDLFMRTYSHVNVVSSNKRLAHLMREGVAHRIDYMYVSDITHREVYEAHLIRTMRPYCNIGKTGLRRHANEDIIKEYRNHIRSA
ncbi:nucleotide excision repair endonuclease [Bacillus cereus]|nr:nucleotide excision repair endonuclease [Bacillus cereus]